MYRCGNRLNRQTKTSLTDGAGGDAFDMDVMTGALFNRFQPITEEQIRMIVVGSSLEDLPLSLILSLVWFFDKFSGTGHV